MWVAEEGREGRGEGGGGGGEEGKAALRGGGRGSRKGLAECARKAREFRSSGRPFRFRAATPVRQSQRACADETTSPREYGDEWRDQAPRLVGLRPQPCSARECR